MDNRYGDRDERWRDRDRDSRYQERGSNDDRGFMDRAGDEVRSWFGDDEAERRREEDDRRWERERGMTGRRDNQSGRDHDSSAGYRGTSGGWGNQSGESWNRERPGTPGSYGAYGAERESSGRDSREERSGNERGYAERSGGGGGGYGGGAGIGASGGYSSSAARYAAARQGSRQDRQGGAARSIGGGGLHDPHYSEWRNRQIESIDRDYDEYRREHQSRFEQDFSNWRTKRGEQRQSMGRVTEHMEVFGSDGEKIGTVEAVHGDRILLARNDENADGHQHSIPCSWVEKVDEKVTVNKSREEAMREWRDEERSRALFESEDQGSSGPHVLNRSFSGTY